MANMTSSISVDVRGTEPVKTLMDLLDKYADQLPEELKDSLHELADCGAVEFGVNEFQEAGGNIGEVETDFHSINIISANKILKRVKYNAAETGEDFIVKQEYPDQFRLGSRGVVFIEWGY